MSDDGFLTTPPALNHENRKHQLVAAFRDHNDPQRSRIDAGSSRVTLQRPLPPSPLTNGDMAHTGAFPSTEPSHRAAPSPSSSPMNGNGVSYAGNANIHMQPFPMSHQQDINYLYQQLQELSNLLQSNRERVNEVTRNADEVAQRAQLHHADHSSPSTELRAAHQKIRDLESQLAAANTTVAAYRHEQSENTALLGAYEETLWRCTDQIRAYTDGVDGRLQSLKGYYNHLLQQEKDDHLQTRLERDGWYDKTLQVCAWLREAARLRGEEGNHELKVIYGLQNEVRCLRRCLGIEAERPEEETGYEYLRDTLLGEAG